MQQNVENDGIKATYTIKRGNLQGVSNVFIEPFKGT